MLPRRHRRRPASYAAPLALAALGAPLLTGLPTASGAGSVVPDPVVLSADDAALSVEPLGTYRTGVFDESAAEIVHPGSGAG